MPRSNDPDVQAKIADARKRERDGQGTGKTCGNCHLKKLACPEGVQAHRWQHQCGNSCVDWETCPTKYKKGHPEILQKEQQEKEASKSKLALEQQEREKGKAQKKEEKQQSKAEKKEKKDREVALKLAAKFTAGKYQAVYEDIHIDNKKTGNPELLNEVLAQVHAAIDANDNDIYAGVDETELEKAAHLGRQIAAGSKMVKKILAKPNTTLSLSTSTTPQTTDIPLSKRMVKDLMSPEACTEELAVVDARMAEISKEQHALTIYRMDIVAHREELHKQQQKEQSGAKRLKRAHSG